VLPTTTLKTTFFTWACIYGYKLNGSTKNPEESQK